MKISLILPYWDRQEAADKALVQLAATYPDLNLEVVVVDDGNLVPFRRPGVGLDIKVHRLPTKTVPKCPATAWNEGVKASSGDIIVLSCIEVLHTYPVLQEMAKQLKELGPRGYVLAAAWCPEEGGWHCHSSVKVPRNPAGTGIAFCGAMHRDLFFKAGGFDEAFRDGAGYEDNDFINRMLSVNAKFVIRDDLVVIHPKSGAYINWGAEAFQRNEKLYYKKWPTEYRQPTNFVCLKAGTQFGPEYVNTLADMVCRNLPQGFPGKFYCITDDPTGLDPIVTPVPLPSDLEKWWGKLYMFKDGLFQDGDRMVFLDLDTLIIGNIEQLASYSGKFATLRDFYYPAQLGPAVICWEAGAVSAIWDKWVEEGKPRHQMGDLWWINQMPELNPEILQDLYPGAFCSYKADCRPYPPKGAKVVCFHGKPRPHECKQDWVKNVWRIDGAGVSELEAIANTNKEIVARNVFESSRRDLSWLSFQAEHDRNVMIVGGGPSLSKSLGEIKWRVANGDTLIAVNGVGRFLAQHGIKANIQIVLDARPENIEFITDADEYYLASQCDPSLFDALAGKHVTVYHMNTEDIAKSLPEGKEANLLSTGTTVALAAMGVAYVLGYRKIHLYGMDSSYSDAHHAYSQPLNDNDDVVEAIVGDRVFKCAPWMMLQVNQFEVLARELANAGCIITVAGEGLLPYVAHMMGQLQEAA